MKPARSIERWRIEVMSGPSKGLVKRFAEGVVRIGSAKSNDIVLEDGKVSRHHLVLEVRATGLRARDLGSKNGSFYKGSRIGTADLPIGGAVLTLGESDLALVPEEVDGGIVPSARDRCGRLLGQSEPMRL